MDDNDKGTKNIKKTENIISRKGAKAQRWGTAIFYMR
jgi:hypothetical protein